MYYVYRYIDNGEIIYIGITNDLHVRYKQHKRDRWLNDKLEYQFIEVKNKYIAKLYEEYLINRDNPKENIADKNDYDVCDIQFNIEEVWKTVNLQEQKLILKKKNSTKCKKISINEEAKLIYDFFFKLLKQSLENIIKIYYDEYQFLTIILRYCENIDKLRNYKYMPSYICKIKYNEKDSYVLFQFKGEEYLEEKEMYYELWQILNVNSLNLDKMYCEKVLDSARNELEKKYINLIDNEYIISAINVKDNIKQCIPITTILNLFGGIICIFAIGLQYVKQKLLIYYEPIKYYEII